MCGSRVLSNLMTMLAVAYVEQGYFLLKVSLLLILLSLLQRLVLYSTGKQPTYLFGWLPRDVLLYILALLFQGMDSSTV